MDKAVAEQLKAQFPNEDLITIVSPDDGIEVVCRAADSATLLKFDSMKGEIADPTKRVMANEFLVLQTLVFPDKEAFRAELIKRKLTGFYSVAVSHIREASGVRENLQVSKL